MTAPASHMSGRSGSLRDGGRSTGSELHSPSSDPDQLLAAEPWALPPRAMHGRTPCVHRAQRTSATVRGHREHLKSQCHRQAPRTQSGGSGCSPPGCWWPQPPHTPECSEERAQSSLPPACKRMLPCAQGRAQDISGKRVPGKTEPSVTRGFMAPDFRERHMEHCQGAEG